MRYFEIIESIQTKFDAKKLLRKISDLKTLQKIDNIFRKEGYEIRLVGGAVRDLILGRTPKDLDLATTAMPENSIDILKRRGIKVIETGLQHGTITAVIDGEEYEITTLRIDRETDGRHADVEWTRDWKKDAERRDLTFNAMSLDLDGTLYDYYGGVEDLKNNQPIFVGNPDARIKEDYLRILRYFRFQGRMDKPQWHDETLDAIKSNASGLKQISGERIWMEMQKIMQGNHASEILDVMHQLNIDQYIDVDLSKVHGEFDRVNNLKLNSRDLLLAALLRNEQDVKRVNDRWKLSSETRDLVKFIVNHRDQTFDRDVSMYMWTNNKIKDQHVYMLALYLGKKDLAQMIKNTTKPEFPVAGQDLIDLGYKPGPELGKILKAMQQAWKESDYTMDKQTLLKGITNESI